MRVIEILREFVDSENTGPTNPVDGLTYLLTYHKLSPVALKLIANTVDSIEKTTAQTQMITPALPVQPAQQPQAVPQPQSPTDDAAVEPTDADNPEYEPTDNEEELTETVMDKQSLMAAIKKLDPKSPKLQGLFYQIQDDVFKKIVSEIVKNKIKFKTRETYELIKSKVRSLSTKVPVDIMDEFLRLCAGNGVIDAPSMISGETPGGPIPLIDQKFRRVADAFLDLNLERLGKGEIGLAFMGIDAHKESSDVSISGLPIEVKAAKGSDFFMKGNPDEGGFGHQAEAAKKFIGALNKAGADFKETNRSKQGGIAAVGKTNIIYLNSFFAIMGRQKTVDTLLTVLKTFCKKSPEIVDNYEDEIINAVKEDGTIIYKNLELVASKINFDYYKAMSGHSGVLVLNLPEFEYAYVNDAEGWADLINIGILVQKYPLDFRSNGLGGIAYDMV
jgi:hypothetical protein